jgi:O-antigen ligase
LDLNQVALGWCGRVFSSVLLKHLSTPTVFWTLVVSLLTAALYILSHGEILLATAFVVVVAIVIITLYRLDWGFYLFVICVLLFEQNVIRGFDALTYKVSYFKNLKEIQFLPSIEQAVVNPLELHLFLLLSVWVLLIALKKKVQLNPVSAWFAALLFFSCLLISFLYGMRVGGDFLPALWEVRAFFYFGIMYFFVPQVIQSEQQVKALMWVCIAMISLKAFLGIARFASVGFSYEVLLGFPPMAHEEPVFFVTLVIFLMALSLFGGHGQQRRALLWLLLPLMFAFYIAQRRAAYAGGAAAIAAFFVLLSGRERLRFLKVALPVIVVMALYAAAFWNSEGRLAAPVRLLQTSLSADREAAGDRYWSNLYRIHEQYDLATTIQRAPLKGIGFGSKYDTPIALPPAFSLQFYIPHNEILWLLVKMGAVGFFCVWFFFGSFLLKGTSVFSQMKNPYLKAVCAVSVVAVINQFVVSYYDLQLTYYRNMIYLGLLMGLVPTLERLDKQALPNPANIQHSSL